MIEPAHDLTLPDEQPVDASGQEYPTWAAMDADKLRWDYSLRTAANLFGTGEDSMLGEGATPSASADILMAAQAIYNSDIPTGDPQPGEADAADPSPGEGQTSAPPLPD